MKEPVSSIKREYSIQELYHRHSGPAFAFARAHSKDALVPFLSTAVVEVALKGKGVRHILKKKEREQMKIFLTDNPAHLRGTNVTGISFESKKFKRATIAGVVFRGRDFEKNRKTSRSCVRASYEVDGVEKPCYGQVLFFLSYNPTPHLAESEALFLACVQWWSFADKYDRDTGLPLISSVGHTTSFWPLVSIVPTSVLFMPVKPGQFVVLDSQRYTSTAWSEIRRLER
jgi:hypothetical protein